MGEYLYKCEEHNNEKDSLVCSPSELDAIEKPVCKICGKEMFRDYNNQNFAFNFKGGINFR